MNMAKARKKPAELVAVSELRNGLNTLLLDLKGDVAAVQATLTTVIEAERGSSEAREAIRRELATLNIGVTALTGTVSSLAATVHEIKPIVTMLHTEYQHRVGVRKFITTGRAMLVGVGGAIATGFHWLFGLGPK